MAASCCFSFITYSVRIYPSQLLAHILQSDGYSSIFIFMLRMDFQILATEKVTVFHSSQHLHDIGKEPGIIPDSHKGYQDSAPCQNDQDKTDPDQRRPVQPPEHLTVNHTNIGKIILAGRKNRIKKSDRSLFRKRLPDSPPGFPPPGSSSIPSPWYNPYEEAFPSCITAQAPDGFTPPE